MLPLNSARRRTSRRVATLLAGLALGATALEAQGAVRATGRIEGLLFDSATVAPLSGALVQLMTADYQQSRVVTADRDGRFRVDSVVPGSWLLSVLHPRLDSLGVRQFARSVNVKERGATKVAMNVPSARALVTQTCGQSVVADSGGFVLGTLRDVEGRDVRDGGVRFLWQDLTLGAGRLERSNQAIEAALDEQGRFVACGVPANALLTVRGWRGNDSTGVLELDVPRAGIANLDLLVGRATRTTVQSTAPGDSVSGPATTVLRGNATLAGVARTPNGTPIANARITVWSTGQEARTDSLGRFLLQSLPSGSFTVEGRALGFEAQRQAIALLPDSVTRTEVLFESLKTLDTIRVRAVRAAVYGRDLQEFEERRRMFGSGQFYGPEDLDRRNLINIFDLLRATPGMRVTTAGVLGDALWMRGVGLSLWCRPAVFIDRMRFENEVRLDNLVNPQFIRAVEVYTSPAMTPQEFSGGVTGCGSVVIWTGTRSRLP